MKPYTYALLAAAVACGMAYSETAYTTPVGYVSLTVPASGDTNIGQPLQRSSVFAASASTVTTDTVGLSSSALTAGQFVYSPPGQTNSYYLRLTSGSLSGRYFEIVSNTTNSITVDTDLAALGVTSGTTFEVTPYWTLNTLFPSGAGVGVSVDELEPVAFVSFVDFSAAGANKSAAKTYFYYQGSGLSGNGWYDNDNTASGKKDDLTIEPFQVAIVRNLEASVKTVVVTGEVPTAPTVSNVYTSSAVNDNYVCLQTPVDISLGQSGLIASGAVLTSVDELEPVDLVSIYDEESSQFNKAAFKTYFHYTGGGLDGNGWYDNDNTAAGKQDNAVILKAGRQILIRKSAGTPGLTLNSTAIPYTL